jgi:hypothetical protein
MKKWMRLVPLLLGMAGGAWAQEIAAPVVASQLDSSHDFPGTPGGSVFLAGFPAAKFAAPVASAALATAAERQVNPRDDDKGQWQLGLGFTYVKFRSPAIDASMEGLNTSVTYFIDDGLGIEGNITAAFGRTIFVDDRTKYVGITGGPKIVMYRRRWEPWAHALIGMARVNPQLAGVGRNGLAIQAGGGADIPLRGAFALRVEGDWVRTQLYSRSQDNFQVVTGLVFRF